MSAAEKPETNEDRREVAKNADGSGLASKAESSAVVSPGPAVPGNEPASDDTFDKQESTYELEGSASSESDELEEEECAFCKFMKGGGCKEQFVAWEECVAEAKQTGDFVSKCAEITEALQLCMNAPENKEYYQLFLDDQEEYVQEQSEKLVQDEASDEHSKAAEEGVESQAQKPEA